MGGTTDFLYARPSFLQGVARVIDFGNFLDDYNTSPTSQEADSQALRNDWAALGADFRHAAESLAEDAQ